MNVHVQLGTRGRQYMELMKKKCGKSTASINLNLLGRDSRVCLGCMYRLLYRCAIQTPICIDQSAERTSAGRDGKSPRENGGRCMGSSRRCPLRDRFWRPPRFPRRRRSQPYRLSRRRKHRLKRNWKCVKICLVSRWAANFLITDSTIFLAVIPLEIFSLALSVTDTKGKF